MRKRIYKIFHPKNLVIICGIILIIVSLAYLILLNQFGTPLSYILYLTMSYSLIIVLIKCYEIIKIIIEKIIESNKYLKRYRDDHKLRYKISLFYSLFLNTIYAIFKLVSGISFKSLWFISFAIYYFILVVMRANISKEELRKNTTLKQEYEKCRQIGITLLFINVFLTIVILIIVNQKIMIPYNMVIAISVAVYTFYLMISSVVNLIKYRKYKSPLMSSAKVINIVTSLVSMLSLEVTMLSTFGPEQLEFNEIMIMATGSGIGIIVIIISLYMIIKSSDYLNNLNE